MSRLPVFISPFICSRVKVIHGMLAVRQLLVHLNLDIPGSVLNSSLYVEDMR